MSVAVRKSQPPKDLQDARPVCNRYGAFLPDGSAFRITDVNTPRPWVNIISNPRFGLAVSHTGSGFTWIDNSQLATITRWEQDLCRDTSGKFVYARDPDSGRLWSLSPAPTWAALDDYACEHGLGYSTFEAEFDGIRSEWTLFCDANAAVEYWRVRLTNRTDRPRRLDLCGYLEWCCGVSPSPRREFHKLFLQTEFDASRGAIVAQNRMWEVPAEQYGHWNAEFPYVSAFACTEPVGSAQADKTEFWGRYGDPRAPKALDLPEWEPRFGCHEDAIAALRCTVELAANGGHELGFVLAVGESRPEVEGLLDAKLNARTMTAALDEAKQVWVAQLAAHRVQTPEPSVDYLTNDWLRYQAISARLWGRCGYYQQSGAFGFRDQLQDSQVWLTIDPARCREQINLHARHQFVDGSVYHWWHPLSEQGHVTRMTDDLLWLAFTTANYIRETGRLDVLNDASPFIDDSSERPLMEHIRRAFARVFRRTGPRGLPYIGAGDWNDGLSAAGLQERGESVWLAHFLAGLLADWVAICRWNDDHPYAQELEERHEQLVAAINEHGWDGEWYLRGTLDDGSKLGSHENRVGRIFLNAQTWAILNDVAPADRAQQCLAAIRKHLVSDAGALLLAPAFDEPDERIGYITRYAAGLRENGGVYTHAATWAIAAACKMRDADLVGRLLTAINPAVKDPERYWAEPYVLPGNVDGPDSPYHGRGGWTWYTGSAAWLQRIICEWVLGVRPEWNGLRIDPCLPADWQHARMTRPYRGCTYEIDIERSETLADGVASEIRIDGRTFDANLLPPPTEPGKTMHVRVLIR